MFTPGCLWLLFTLWPPLVVGRFDDLCGLLVRGHLPAERLHFGLHRLDAGLLGLDALLQTPR
jgi:hypothetical protein